MSIWLRYPIMYYVCLSGIQWYDTIIWSSIVWYRPWDLLTDTTGSFLCLWKNIVFSTLYTKQRQKEYAFIQPLKAYKQLLSAKSLEVIHWMVQHYFSSYKHVIWLYIPDNISQILPKKVIEKEVWEQTCIIFPDLRTLTQTYPLQNLWTDSAIVHGWMTIIQKTKLFRGIKSWTIKTILATNRGLFFDRQNITNIVIYSPTSRAYSWQAEPRFVIKEVTEKVGGVYGATLEYKA